MKKMIFLCLFFTGQISVFPIVPPREKGFQIPTEMLENIRQNPSYYMPGRGLIRTMQRFRDKKSTMLKVNQPLIQEPVTAGIPVLCGQYADLEDEWPISNLQMKLFGSWPTGSMHDYYLDVSYGQFLITGQVTGWYPVSGNSQYYERENDHTGEFLRELFQNSDDTLDYGQYDNDGPDGLPNSGDDDGYVDVVAVVHSGSGGEEGGPGIWSHSWQYRHYYGQPYETNDNCVNGGKIKIDDYIIQPAIENSKMVEIGVFCHEFGHALGLPDLYDRDDEGETSEGVGVFCLMGAGSWGGDGQSPEYPAYMSAWCKEVLGWIDPIVLDQNLNEQTIPSVKDSPTVYKLWTHGIIEPWTYQSGIGLSVDLGKEYFLIENRQNRGFDINLSGTGLLVWHIDNTVTSWNDDEIHKLVDLEEADNRYDLDAGRNRGDEGDPYPGISENTIFNRTSKPNSLDYFNYVSKVAVLNISSSADTMTADLQVVADDIDFEGYQLDNETVNDDGYLDPGETANLVIHLKNHGSDIGTVTAVLSTEDTSVFIQDSLALYSSVLEDAVVSNQVDPFRVTILPGAEVHPIFCTLKLQTDQGFETTIDFILMMENIYILLVDDSSIERDENGIQILNYYTDALNDLNISYYDIWETGLKGSPDSLTLDDYGAVFWFTGSRKATLNSDEQTALKHFMMKGGDVFLSGQNIGYDLVETGTQDDRVFFENWLHARFLQDIASDQPVIIMTGIQDDPVSDKFRPYFFITEGDGANNQTSPSIIDPDSLSSPVFDYFGTGLMGKHGGIKHEGDYQLVYFAFSFEAINDFGSRTITRKDIFGNVIGWLQGTLKPEVVTEVHDMVPVSLPTRYGLFQNYPNPFNPETTIPFQLPERSDVQVNIYDLQGRRIRTVIDRMLIPGEYSVSWDGKNENGQVMASGIYFYRLIAGRFHKSRKMVLIR